MKTAMHPTYSETSIVCACGATYPTCHVHPRSPQRVLTRKPSRGPPLAHAWGIAGPSPSTRTRGCSATVWSRVCGPPLPASG
jgi:hypothetical protein